MSDEPKQVSMPIDRINYSSLTQLLRNPLIFKLREILHAYDSKMSPSGLIGSAGHKALETYYGGNKDVATPQDPDQARQIGEETGLKFIDGYQDAYIDYGKTGSRKDVLKGFTQSMKFYWEEEPYYHEILMIEEKMSSVLHTFDGQELPLPASGVPDLVVKNEDGSVDIIDTKFVKSFTDYETEDYIKIIQSQFLIHLLRDSKGITAKRVIFREVKRTKNAPCEESGCSEVHDAQRCHKQIRDYVIPADHEPYRIIFYNIYRDVVKFLSIPDQIFLPNLSDMFDGEHAGMIYAQGLISADMSDVEVMHKVRDVAYTSKKFVSSRLERAENKNLLPEERVSMAMLDFGIPMEPVETKVGATVTQYRFKVSRGIKMGTIEKHSKDIIAALQATGTVRVLAPIPGTNLVGIEVENIDRQALYFDKKYLTPDTLMLPLGVDVAGECVKLSLGDAPHLLIGGTTGSGKSKTIEVIVHALTRQMTPDQLRLTLIDPKRVELAPFAKFPHVDGKVLYEHKDVMRVLLGLTDEMESRYRMLEKAGKRNIGEFNASKRSESAKMTYKVVIIDEFADLMMRSKIEEKKGTSYSSHSIPWLKKEIARRTGKNVLEDGKPTKAQFIEYLEELDLQDDSKRGDANVEHLIVRLAQMARAIGIHLIIATQSPRVDVITGLIKANFPTRIALRTSSRTESEIILGEASAEKLSGKGDMILMSPSHRGNVRLQGFLIK